LNLTELASKDKQCFIKGQESDAKPMPRLQEAETVSFRSPSGRFFVCLLKPAAESLKDARAKNGMFSVNRNRTIACQQEER
jgi:hypothetical protein